MTVYERTTNENDMDAVELWEKLKRRQALEKELSEKRWTLAEVEALEGRASTDGLDAIREYKAMLPYITASNARQEFEYPWQMTRQEAREYLTSKGVDAEPWSLKELRAISSDPALWESYGPELKRAQETGALIIGPNANKGALYSFAGETDEQAERELNRKLVYIDQRRVAEKTIADTIAELPNVQRNGVTKEYIERQFGLLYRDNNDMFPVTKLEGFEDMRAAFLSAGGSPMDISQIAFAAMRAQR